MSAGASKELSSFFLFGKNLRLVGASVKDCVLLYKRTEGEVMMFMVMVMVMMLVVMVMMAMVMMMLKGGGGDDDDDGDDGDGDDDVEVVQEAEGGRLETFLICAGPGAQPTLVKRLTFR